MKKNVTAKSISMSISCAVCGEPLTKTSAEFGMDCANDCGQLASKALPLRIRTILNERTHEKD